MRISSPAFRNSRAKPAATRLIASVVPRVKTISFGEARAEEARDLLAAALVGLGGLLGEPVRAAVDVRVLFLVVAAVRVDHDARLLRRVRVVEVDEGLAVDGTREDRELGADALHVVGARARLGGGLRDGAHRFSGAARFAGSHARRWPSRKALTSADATFSISSLPKAYVRRARAASGERPRERR